MLKLRLLFPGFIVTSKGFEHGPSSRIDRRLNPYRPPSASERKSIRKAEKAETVATWTPPFPARSRQQFEHELPPRLRVQFRAANPVNSVRDQPIGGPQRSTGRTSEHRQSPEITSEHRQSPEITSETTKTYWDRTAEDHSNSYFIAAIINNVPIQAKTASLEDCFKAKRNPKRPVTVHKLPGPKAVLQKLKRTIIRNLPSVCTATKASEAQQPPAAIGTQQKPSEGARIKSTPSARDRFPIAFKSLHQSTSNDQRFVVPPQGIRYPKPAPLPVAPGRGDARGIAFQGQSTRARQRRV